MQRRSQAGQALVLASFGLTLFMLAAGLAIDMGYLRYQKRRMQSAADSAAIAGAAELNSCDADLTCLTNAARTDAAANGFTDGQNGVSIASPDCFIAINTAPLTPSACTTSVPFISGSSTPYVQVTVTQATPTFFMRIAGLNSVSVKATATAYLAAGKGCVYALGGGISAPTGALNLQASGCGILDAGNLALVYPSHSLVGYYVEVSGTYDGEGTVTQSNANPHNAPSTGIAPASDPVAYLQNSAPSAGACGGGMPTSVPPPSVLPGANYVLSGGVFPCGLEINPTSGRTVTLDGSAGPFVLGESGAPCPTVQPPATYGTSCSLSITGDGTGDVLSASSGVTLYNASAGGSVAINALADYDSTLNMYFPMYSGSVVQLVAPTDPSNAYAGVVFIQNASNTHAATVTLGNGYDPGDTPNKSGFPSATCNTEAVASSGSCMLGVMYFPTAELDMSGIGPSGATCSEAPRLTTVVAYALVMSNDLDFGAGDCASPLTPPTVPDPIKAAVLVQ